MIAEWDQWAKRLEVVISGQGVHDQRLLYSRMLGIPEDEIRVDHGRCGRDRSGRKRSHPGGAGRRGGRHDPR